ncbi:MAG: hypothetical protein ACLQFR_06715 [Streptosporangiaceae bacterium]
MRDIAVGRSVLPGAAGREAADAAARNEILGLLGRADLEVCAGWPEPARPAARGRVTAYLSCDSSHLATTAAAKEPA